MEQSRAKWQAETGRCEAVAACQCEGDVAYVIEIGRGVVVGTASPRPKSAAVMSCGRRYLARQPRKLACFFVFSAFRPEMFQE